MAELFPIVAGLFVGAALARTFRGFRLGASVVLSAIAIGFSATVLSGEWLQSWEFLFVDIPEALAAAALTATLVTRRALFPRGRRLG